MLGMRGLRAVSIEQLNWLKHTRDSLREMGAEYLARKMTELMDAIDRNDSTSAARFLDLLTSIRVFDRVLTLESSEHALRRMAAEEDEATGAR